MNCSQAIIKPTVFFTQLFPCSFTIITSERPNQETSAMSLPKLDFPQNRRGNPFLCVANFSETTRYIGFSIPPIPTRNYTQNAQTYLHPGFHNPIPNVGLLPFNLWSSVTIQVIIPRLWPFFGLKF